MNFRLPLRFVKALGLAAVGLSVVAVFAFPNGVRENVGCVQSTAGQVPAVTVPATSVGDTDDQRVAAARQLLTKCLDAYKGSWVPAARLLDYRIEKSELLYARVEPRPYVKITYAVWPLLAAGDWVAGNGIQQGGWIVGKVAFLQLSREGDTYWIRSMGTGP